MTLLKLPKDIPAGPEHDTLLKLLTADASPLWEKGRNPVATLSLTRAATAAIRGALASKRATQGLEQIEKDLGHEQRGLDALKKKTSSAQNARVSRMLFITNDGSERFYRQCDLLLTKYSERLLGSKLNVSGEELGTAVLGPEKLTRALLITDKKAVAQILLALCRQTP